jgi:hypothetical protein
MSGGSICNNSYPQYQVSQFADELENRIENNDVKDEYGYSPGYPEEVLVYLREQVVNLRKISEVMRAVDFLYAGDSSPDSFLRNIQKIEGKVNPT